MNITISPKDQTPKVSIGMGVPPLITTIIPTYRRPKLLARAIKSALNQTYPHLRVCVYDDASNDETAEVVADLVKKDARVSYYCHSKNVGSAGNYNYALKNIRTPFFSLLGDDDILLPEFYETAINALHKYPEAAFYATQVINMHPDGSIRATNNSAWGDGYYLPPEGLLAMLENGRQPPIWTGTLFRTIVIEHIGLLDEEVGGTYDIDYSQRIATRFSYVKSKVPGAIYFSNPSSESTCTDHGLTWPGSLKMIRNLTDDRRIPSFIRKQASIYLMKALKLRIIRYGKQYIIAKQYDNAYNMANILYRDLGAKLWALMIYTTAKCCRRFPCLHDVLLYFIGLRRRLSFRKREILVPPDEKYAHYLNGI